MEVDLADRDVEVLHRVAEYPEPTISTIRESLYWAEKNQHVHYRVDKLEERGLVDVRKDEEASSRGPLAPNRVSLTSEGEELVEMLDGGGGYGDSVEARLDGLEKQVDVASDAYGELKRMVVERGDRIGELEQENERLREDVERLQSVLEDIRSKMDDGIGRGSEEAFRFE